MMPPPMTTTSLETGSAGSGSMVSMVMPITLAPEGGEAGRWAVVCAAQERAGGTELRKTT
jgi:hypothetical protein